MTNFKISFLAKQLSKYFAKRNFFSHFGDLASGSLNPATTFTYNVFTYLICLLQFSFVFLGMSRATFGLAKWTYWGIPMNLLVAGET